jgi:hypothetical protein
VLLLEDVGLVDCGEEGAEGVEIEVAEVPKERKV